MTADFFIGVDLCDEYPMPRFVVLTHDHPFDHWDFMLEVNGVLWTWRLRENPQSSPIQSAERIGDHRVHYLDYEGPVSGDRGRVTQWDAGTFKLDEATNERTVATLSGKKLQGIATLQHNTWTFQASGGRQPIEGTADSN